MKVPGRLKLHTRQLALKLAIVGGLLAAGTLPAAPATAAPSPLAAPVAKAPLQSTSPALAGPAGTPAAAVAPSEAVPPPSSGTSPPSDELGTLVTASLAADSLSIRPGSSVRVGLRLKMKPGWHTYWRSPGDSGLPTTLDWVLPSGVSATPLGWPAPERFIVGGLANFGYADEAVLLTDVSAAADLKPGTDAVLKATASWLVCKEICVPGQADLSLTLAISRTGPTPDPGGTAQLNAAESRMPRPAPWPVSFAVGARTVVLHVPADNAGRIKSALFLPATEAVIDNAAAQKWGQDETGQILTIPRSSVFTAAPPTLDGVLVLEEDTGGSLTRTALWVSATPGGAPPEEGIAWRLLGQTLGLALLGGLVLNLMPCVFPVLSLKVVGLAQQARLVPRQTRNHGWAYTAGVLLSFAALGSLLGLLKLAGNEVGWGFQLQSPVSVAVLAYVLLALGLNMSGVFDVGGTFMGLGSNLAALPGTAGTFFSGVLATIVATPCTAPFMGAALGYALTQSFPVQLLVLLALGFGLAFPYLLLSHLPGLARLLPKPGLWMSVLKQVLAVPLYATVVWLVWVLSLETDRVGLIACLAGLLLVALAGVAIGRAGSQPPRFRPPLRNGALAAVAIAVILLVLPGTERNEAMAATSTPFADGAEPFSEERLAALIEQKRPVFVDYTAAWCITCLVNERTALASEAVRSAFADKQVVLMQADWTRQNPEITRSLKRYGHNGVPLYLLYGRGSSTPTILPQILTASTLVEAVNRF